MSGAVRFRGSGTLLAGAWLAALAGLALWALCSGKSAALEMNLERVLEAPSPAHWLGTDSLGRDLFARLAYGAAVSLGVGTASVGLAVLLGVLIGALAGYFGGWRDRVLMGFTDLMLCFPTFFLILAVIAVLGPGLEKVMAVIGVTGWMGTARLVRAEVLSLKEREFVLASRALGARSLRILWGHLVPNAAGPVIVMAVLAVPSAVLTESALSFLGLGVQPPTPSWGNTLMDGKALLGAAWWVTFFPGAAIFVTALAVNRIGEALHDRLRVVRG